MLASALLHPLLHLAAGEVLVAGVHCLELAAVDRRHQMGKQVQPSTHPNKPPACRADRRTVVLAKIRDGLEVRSEPSGEPDPLDIVEGLPL
jgi:hypothetical protein